MALLMQEYHHIHFLSWGGGGEEEGRGRALGDLALHVDCGIRKGCNREGE